MDLPSPSDCAALPQRSQPLQQQELEGSSSQEGIHEPLVGQTLHKLLSTPLILLHATDNIRLIHINPPSCLDPYLARPCPLVSVFKLLNICIFPWHLRLAVPQYFLKWSIRIHKEAKSTVSTVCLVCWEESPLLLTEMMSFWLSGMGSGLKTKCHLVTGADLKPPLISFSVCFVRNGT